MILTNRRRAQAALHSVPIVANARKPWTQRSTFSEPVTCVIGDQFLTDGLLAARLGVLYLRVPTIDPFRRPLAASGDTLMMPLFRPASKEIS
jgi:predicted HAD superfamily phosphohydrolase YqeG